MFSSIYQDKSQKKNFKQLQIILKRIVQGIECYTRIKCLIAKKKTIKEEQRSKKKDRKHETKLKKANINIIISIITLSVTKLNSQNAEIVKMDYKRRSSYLRTIGHTPYIQRY